MITIYSPTETDFTHNGFGAITATKAIVVEELNGMYELSLVMPTAGNENRLEHVVNDAILRVPTPRSDQLFRIYDVKETIDNIIQISAEHIFYDLRRTLIHNVSGTMTAHAAINQLVTMETPNLNFSASSNIPSQINVEAIDTNPVAALFGDGGLVYLTGGEVMRNNFDISLQSATGEDRGFVVEYRKNLTGLDVRINTRDIITRVKPVGVYRDSINPENNEDLHVPGVFIDSPLIGDYIRPYVKALVFSDVRADAIYWEDVEMWPGGGTVRRRELNTPRTNEARNEAIAELQRRGHEFFASGADLPSINAKVDFVMLRDTLEYTQFAELENLYLGDVVVVAHAPLQLRLRAKCVKIEYDALKRQYRRIELGDHRDDFATSTGLSVAGLNRTVGMVARHQALRTDRS